MEKEIEKIKQECEEYLAGWKRAKADFLNYKKEEAERMQEMALYLKASFLINMLPIVDNLERAEREVAGDEKDSTLAKGLLQIVSQCREFLKKQGITAIETVGKPFDPSLHEAVEEADSKTGEVEDTIVEVLEKGYMMDGKVLRPAKVKVVK